MAKRHLRQPSKYIVSILACNVIRLRRSLSMSQEQLADKSGLHRTYIGSIERCERNVTLSTLEVLANSLGVSVTHLLSDIGAEDD